MIMTTGEQMRAWRGPAVFSYGFRPFFFAAALWAAMAMVGWVLMLSGWAALPTAFDPVSWHAHEFLFGYLGAVMAGFLLTAVPNWTGRPPITGWPLAILFVLWAAGRAAIAVSNMIPPAVVAAADLALPVALAAAVMREIIAAKNWRNLGVLALLGIFAFGNGVFHCEAARGEFAAQGQGLRIAIGAGVMMIALVGGRIVPAFTRNWLVQNNPGRLPVPPGQVFDKVALAVLLAAVGAWVLRPADSTTAVLLGLAGLLHVLRLGRWAGDRTLGEPLLWILHLGYAFVPLGAIILAAANFLPGTIAPSAGQHLWTAGAIGVMTLAVMARATRGHTGRPLHADGRTAALFVALLGAVTARVAAGIWPVAGPWLYVLSGAAWVAAFGGFCLAYGSMLLGKRQG
jgi:uncharacterized protein involved in response to NO